MIMLRYDAGLMRLSHLQADLTTYWSRAGVQAAIKNSGWLLIDKFIRLVMGFFVGVWVARYLGPEGYGQLGYLFALFGMLSVVTTLGMDSVFMRFLVRYKRRQVEILGTAIFLRFWVSGVFFFLFSLWGIFFQSMVHPWAVVALAAGFLVQPWNLVRYWFDARLWARYVVLAELAAFALSTVLKVVLILQGASVGWFIGITTVETTLGILGFVIVYFVKGEKMKVVYVRRLAKVLLRQSLPLIVASSAVTIYMRIDQVMLTHLVGVAETGVYAAAVRLSEIWYFVPSIVVASAAPAIIQSRKQNYDLYLQRIQRLMSVLTLMAYIVIAVVSLTAWFVVPLLYGVAYQKSVWILLVHVWGGVAVFQGTVVSFFYINENLSGRFSFFLFFIVLINVFLNFLFIPNTGAVGAALSTVLASLSFLFLNYFSDKTREMFRMQIDAYRLKSLFNRQTNL